MKKKPTLFVTRKMPPLVTERASKTYNAKFNDIDIILAPAVGGIVVGYEVGRQMKIKTIFAERVNGKLLLRRDFSIPEQTNVLIIEDVITTGKSALECYELIKINKANLVGFVCIIDRSDEKSLINKEIISQIKFKITTYTKDNLPNDIKNIKAEKPGTRHLSK